MSMSTARRWATGPAQRLQASRRSSVGMLIACFGVVSTASAGLDDTYGYAIVRSTNHKLCGHVHRVLSSNFKTPWERPPLDLGKDSPYGIHGSYAFDKLAGVEHDNRTAFRMGYAKLPTSGDFQAIAWREGRYRFVESSGKDHGDLPFLVAEFDIDNDGHAETVVKTSFMTNYWPSHRSVEGGEDTLFIFRGGSLDLSRKLDSGAFYKGQDGKQSPAMLQLGNARLVRPFMTNGVVYLLTYQQEWKGGEFRGSNRIRNEFMNVLLYRSGRENLGGGKWSPVQTDLVCRYRMHVVTRR
jgi:hypothetical protein